MIYRVFDTSINRLFGAFGTEEEAIALVQTLIGTNDDDVAVDLAVGYEQADGAFSEPLSGGALLTRVEEVLAPRQSTVARDNEVIALPR